MTEIVTGGLMALLALLPDSPFKDLLDDLAANAQIREILGMVNWFIPFYIFVPVLTAWLGCIAIYYIYQVALRWVKAIE